MGEFKHTAGPWKLDGEFVSGSGHFQAPMVSSHADPDKPRFIAEIAVGPKWEENGYLIAASPLGYALAEEIVNHLYEKQDIARVRELAREFLQKAQGGGE